MDDLWNFAVDVVTSPVTITAHLTDVALDTELEGSFEELKDNLKI